MKKIWVGTYKEFEEHRYSIMDSYGIIILDGNITMSMEWFDKQRELRGGWDANSLYQDFRNKFLGVLVVWKERRCK